MKLTCIPSKSSVNELEKTIDEALVEQEHGFVMISDEDDESDEQIVSELENEFTEIYGPMNFKGDEDIYLALERMQRAGHIDMLRNYAMNHYVDRYKNPFRRKMYGRRKWLEHIQEWLEFFVIFEINLFVCKTRWN